MPQSPRSMLFELAVVENPRFAVEILMLSVICPEIHVLAFAASAAILLLQVVHQYRIHLGKLL